MHHPKGVNLLTAEWETIFKSFAEEVFASSHFRLAHLNALHAFEKRFYDSAPPKDLAFSIT